MISHAVTHGLLYLSIGDNGLHVTAPLHLCQGKTTFVTRSVIARDLRAIPGSVQIWIRNLTPHYMARISYLCACLYTLPRYQWILSYNPWSTIYSAPCLITFSEWLVVRGSWLASLIPLTTHPGLTSEVFLRTFVYFSCTLSSTWSHF